MKLTEKLEFGYAIGIALGLVLGMALAHYMAYNSAHGWAQAEIDKYVDNLPAGCQPGLVIPNITIPGGLNLSMLQGNGEIDDTQTE